MTARFALSVNAQEVAVHEKKFLSVAVLAAI
jgi:hypothetical protein